MQKLALVMIVRDEMHVIERVLTKTLPLVDTWVIVDTGSVDKTMSMIEQIAKEHNKPGHLYSRKWINFAHNRSELLQLSKGVAEWALMCDADDYYEGGMLPNLDRKFAGYFITIEESDCMRHRRIQLMNIIDHDWKYKSVVHEYPYCNNDKNIGEIPLPFLMRAQREGARSRDPNKYLKDAQLLEADLTNPEGNYARTVFYLAQSYLSANVPQKAIKWYKKCESLKDNWVEERYISCYHLIHLSTSIEDKIKWTWKAQSHNRERKDGVFALLEYARKNNIWNEEIYALGFTYKDCKESSSMLFIDMKAYSWQYWDELALHAFYTCRYKHALVFSKLAISCGAVDSSLERIQNNINNFITPRMNEVNKN